MMDILETKAPTAKYHCILRQADTFQDVTDEVVIVSQQLINVHSSKLVDGSMIFTGNDVTLQQFLGSIMYISGSLCYVTG